MSETVDVAADDVGLTDTLASRRYFQGFESIVGHLPRVAATMQAEGALSKLDVQILSAYIGALAASFRALGHKYLMTGRETGALSGALTIDRIDSGFPVFRELLLMANDAQQAQRHLAGMAAPDALKDQMVRQILTDLTVPTKLQFALSQRLYYQALAEGELFWATNDPVAHWTHDLGARRAYTLHWAVYDSQTNLPHVYLMEVEDDGPRALPTDTGRWPEAQRHLISQSVGGLKLLTIAQGFDTDFPTLHPKRLRRFHLGPMYSATYTLQTGPLREVLGEAGGDDWALAWTVETLESQRVEVEKGWFSSTEREIYALDPVRGAETGATRTERALILPARPYQVLSERNPAGFANVRKFVVSPQGRVLSYR
jgi:hypothetical protein